MAGHDIIVIGASAGGVEALTRLVPQLPVDLPAAIFVVVHFPAYGTSVLPGILSRQGPLPAIHAEHGAPIEPGRIYVAPPDHHIVLHPGRVHLGRGPRENGHRPAVDPLFRSAAAAYGPRVVGVVLSGTLDDGTAGLQAVKSRGGVAVVQDPADALFAGMPGSALENVSVDHVVPLSGLAGLLASLARTEVPGTTEEDAMDDDEDGARGEGRMEFEADIAEMDPESLTTDDRPGTPSGYSCPECHGVLWSIEEGDLVRFRCRVGHAYGAETLIAEQTAHVEAALWTALQALKERADLSRRMATRLRDRGHPRSAARFVAQADEAEMRAGVIREVLRRGTIGGEAVPK